jgi:hypothetical protein
VQDFEGVAGTTYSSAGSLPACWNGYSNGTSSDYVPHVVSSGTYWYTSSGDKALGFTSGSESYGNTKYALMPPVDVALSQLELTFWMCTESSTNGVLTVGYVTSDDTATFTPIQAFPASSATMHSGTGLQTANGAVYTVSLSNVPSNATRIAFKWVYASSYYSCFIDDVVLGYAPTCPKPGVITANATANTITLSWLRGGTESTWEVTLGDEVAYATDTFYTFTGLESNTPYDATVRAICGVGDTSLARTGYFRTACGAITQLPYSYGFEDLNTGSSSVRPDIPCWQHLNNGTTYFGYPYVNSTTPHSGTRNLYWYGTTTMGTYGDYQIVVLPGIDTTVYPINTLQLTFWARPSSTSYYPVFEVGVMSDPTDANTFQTVQTVNVQNVTTSQESALMFSNCSGTSNLMAFRLNRPSSSYYA